MLSIGGRCLRGSARSYLRSSPFWRLGTPRVRNHLSERIQLATLHHTEMARELSALRDVVSSTTESALGRSPDEIFRVEVVGKLVARF
jgi:hypothetical protein